MFLDEGGFSLLPLVRRTWAPVGATPILRRIGRHRQKVSAISAVTVSPRRRRLGLYYRFFPDRSAKAPDVIEFLRHLLRHVRGRVILLWDRSNSHKAAIVKAFLCRVSARLEIKWLPAYAPELNPDEHVWGLLKHHRLANHGLRTLDELHRRLHYHMARLRKRQDLLWACIRASDLPFDTAALSP